VRQPDKPSFADRGNLAAQPSQGPTPVPADGTLFFGTAAADVIVESCDAAMPTRFLDDGRLCMSNNAAERAVRCVAVGRKNWTFAGSDEGGRRAAAIYTLIETAKLSDIDLQAWLADVVARLPDHPAKRIAELLPRSWRAQSLGANAA
jgi:hypothetical protein